ncbi:hypothetical protein DPMN_055024 [Dreissena polymorpha]|uniref:Uncharacterized protein n=1 Tax=Dreissena polymorpha TaxID=45954 RepID=A0A9D4CQL1_DREPO|nr:hypothetical protein DPMN_055024 [Dreissena polymorpha]
MYFGFDSTKVVAKRAILCSETRVHVKQDGAELGKEIENNRLVTWMENGRASRRNLSGEPKANGLASRRNLSGRRTR